MIKNDNSLIKYLFLLGLSEKTKEQILEDINNNESNSYIPEVLSYYSNEGINSMFDSIKKNLGKNESKDYDLLNNIFPMKSDYLDIITSDEYDEVKVKEIKDTYSDYIIRIKNNKNPPEYFYHCFQYEFNKGEVDDLILNFGVLIFYENLIDDENKRQKIDEDDLNIYTGKALVLISEKPIFSLMKQILEKIYSDIISQKFTPFHLEPFFINFINSINSKFSSIKFKNGISITYNPSQELILPFCDLNLGYFFEIFDLNDIFLIAEYYFLNKSIIIISPNIELMYPIYHILMTLFFPLNFHLRSYFYKLLYPLLVVEGLCSFLPCFYFIYTDINKNEGYINENVIKKIAAEKKDVLIYQIKKIKSKENKTNKFDIKKNIYTFNEIKIIENPIESMKEKTLIESIITNDFVYKSIINSEYKKIKKLVENKEIDFFDNSIDLKEYDLLRKNFLGMIIKFLVIKIKPLTFTLNSEDKMEICPLIIENNEKEKKDESDMKVEEFLDSPQTEVIYKNSFIKNHNQNIDYLKTQMLLDNFIKISQSDPNTFYFDDDNININNDKKNKTNNNINIEFEEMFNYKNFLKSGENEYNKNDENNNNNIIDLTELKILKKYIPFDKEKIEDIFGNQIKFVFLFNENFILNFDKYNITLDKSKNEEEDKLNIIKINDIISSNNQKNLLYYYLILYEAKTFKKLFYTINTKNKKELSACYIGLYVSLYILNLLTLLQKGTEEEKQNEQLINSINILFEKLFTLFTKTICFYGKYNFITTLIYLILSSYLPLKIEYKERFIYSLQELKNVPSIIIFLLYNENIEFNLSQNDFNKKEYKEQKILSLKKKKHEHKFELEKISSNFVCIDNNCQEYMWFDIVNSEKEEKICENALNPICKIEEILEKIEEKNSLIIPEFYDWDYIYQVCILDDIYFNIRFFMDDYLDEIEY